MNFLSFPQQSSVLSLEYFLRHVEPLVFCVLLEASFPALIISLRKLGMTSENEEIETATSTPRGQKLLRAKCYSGIWGQEKAIYFSQHFTGKSSGVTPLKQVISYIFPRWGGSLSEEREQCPSAYMKWIQRGSVPVVPRSQPHLNVLKDPPAMQKSRVWSLGQEDPWRRKWQPTPVFLPGVSHGQRSLEGYSPWGHKGWDATEHALSVESSLQHKFWLQPLSFQFSHLGVVLKDSYF